MTWLQKSATHVHQQCHSIRGELRAMVSVDSVSKGRCQLTLGFGLRLPRSFDFPRLAVVVSDRRPAPPSRGRTVCADLPAVPTGAEDDPSPLPDNDNVRAAALGSVIQLKMAA